jgi:hypothetical protein
MSGAALLQARLSNSGRTCISRKGVAGTRRSTLGCRSALESDEGQNQSQNHLAVSENQSRRDSAIVAQYEVLGNGVKADYRGLNNGQPDSSVPEKGRSNISSHATVWLSSDLRQPKR